MTKTLQPLKDHSEVVVRGSRGIGAGIVRRLAEDGAGIAVTYAAAADKANELVQQIAAGGVRAIAIKADSGNEAELRDAVAKTKQQFGRLDILVVNAGVLIQGGILEYRMEDLDRILAVNVRGVVVAIQAAAAHMGQGGRVITIGSNTAVRTGFPGASIYSMTKGAIASLVRGVAIDLAPRGITVNNVQPGPTVTDMTSVPGLAEMVTPLIPLGRMGSTTEIAAMVERVKEAGVGWLPAGWGAGPFRGRALIEQEHLGEVVTEPCARFGVRAGHGSWRTCRHCGGLSEFRHGRIRAVPDHVIAGGAVILEDPAEHIGQIGGMDGAPVLSTGAEHDQIAVAVPGGSEQDSGDPAPTIAVGSA